jgi:SulP family sulfate permease
MVSLRQWWDRPHRDILSGLVVAFAMIPEAIAFSGIAGVDPRVGLFGAFLLSVTLAVVGGRTAMITSATGSTALLMTGLVQQGNGLGEGMGLQYLLAAGLLTGVLQIAWGYLRLAHQMRFVPQPVMAGFVNALAILIFTAQLPQLGLDVFHPEKVTVLAGQLPAVWGLMALTLAIIYLLPRFTTAVPSALVAILISTGLSIRLGLEVPTVASLGTLPEGLPQLGLPQVPFNFETLGLILPTALAISLVGLMETFLTQDILDDIIDSSSHKNAEARGQGIGNIVSSLFGGMAGCALVGQSVMNVGYGGRTRLSTLTSGVALLAMILLASQWVNQIPMATLVGVMIMIDQHRQLGLDQRHPPHPQERHGRDAPNRGGDRAHPQPGGGSALRRGPGGHPVQPQGGQGDRGEQRGAGGRSPAVPRARPAVLREQHLLPPGL